MKIVDFYSHLNGWEFLQVHKPEIWKDIEDTIASVDAEKCRTKISKEQQMKGQLKFSPSDMNDGFKKQLSKRGWQEERTSYYVTRNVELVRQTLQLPAAEQKEEIEKAGSNALYSYNQTDFVKERVAVEVQFGKYAFVAYDLFVKHMAFFVGDKIDLGIEIVPMKSLQSEMSSGPAHYEGELYNLLRQGRSTPAVPLVLVGIGS
ncbi:BglII/BstYI family type II restriction endonuclease [Ruegeria sp. HKCCSP351]|uniref:BglII/BstYI family type II restriction endonuclease n=1 Tax=Ruegeria sp. HKCCSP351 TaxID=2794832 RepID=UPI001AE1BF51|nr:BglII/BstYI family type II restriction endonuclease [Ruegeria sp. HKCCSP351]